MIPGFDKLSQELQTIVERELQMKRRETLAYLPELAGKNLACVCSLDQPCHADTLICLANPASTQYLDGDKT